MTKTQAIVYLPVLLILLDQVKFKAAAPAVRAARGGVWHYDANKAVR
jgi:hypothetical protein